MLLLSGSLTVSTHGALEVYGLGDKGVGFGVRDGGQRFSSQGPREVWYQRCRHFHGLRVEAFLPVTPSALGLKASALRLMVKSLKMDLGFRVWALELLGPN